ncbi:MAG: transporter substrate-binding domain-containing protein [Desulfobacteraceae bacterium]|nr:transporter substrate-binding domain-containing protein [Desulfobacteraceae bacterium]
MIKSALKFILAFLVISFFWGCNKTSTSENSSSRLSQIINSGEIRVAIDASDYPPFSIKTQEGFVGFDIDICKDIAQKMGVKLKLEQVEFEKIIPAVENGEYDLGVATFTITPKRNMNVLFSQPYIVTGQAVVMSNKYRDSVFSYRDLNSTQYKIAFVKGNSSEGSLKRFMPESRFFSVESADDLVQSIIDGQADAFIADMPYCSTMAAKDGGRHLYFIDQPITFEPIGIVANKSDFHLLNWINNYIRQIQSDGTYDDFYIKWFQNSDWIKYLKN